MNKRYKTQNKRYITRKMQLNDYEQTEKGEVMLGKEGYQGVAFKSGLQDEEDLVL